MDTILLRPICICGYGRIKTKARQSSRSSGLRCGGLKMFRKIKPEDMTEWLYEAARYFENRPTEGEDRAYWSNQINAFQCRVIGDHLASLNKKED